jgi:hypothetical protein
MFPPLSNKLFNKPFYIVHKIIISEQIRYNSFMTAHRIELIGAVAKIITPNGTHSGMDITIQNVNESGNIYVGGVGVSTTNYGYKIMPNHAISFELPGLDALYLIADNANSQAAILSIGLESQD